MSNWKRNLQSAIGVGVDGVLGPASYRALFERLGAPRDTAAALAIGAAKWLPHYGIDDTAGRLVEFLGECGHESAGFARLTENLNYRPEQMLRVWPARFPTLALANQFAGKPAELADYVYAGRLGNGPSASGDGWRFRGRGLIQITGRDNYRLAGLRTGIAIEFSPDLAADPSLALLLAASWWDANALNPYADRGESRAVSGIVNRGSPSKEAAGLDDRQKRKARLWEMVR